MPSTDQGVSISLRRNRYTLIPRTLCFVMHGRAVLLLKGAPAKRIWPGRYNGVGGHVERDEDVSSAAAREIREETGLEIADLRLRGVINIDTGETTGIGLFVFTAQAHSRETKASDEGTLEWVPFGQTSALDLVEDLHILLPRVLAMGDHDPPFFARYSYDENDQLVIDFDTD